MPSIMMVNNDLPVKSIAEPDSLCQGQSRQALLRHARRGHAAALAGELFCHLAGIKMEHIPIVAPTWPTS
jgi:hypothetical protein